MTPDLTHLSNNEIYWLDQAVYTEKQRRDKIMIAEKIGEAEFYELEVFKDD